MTVRKAIGAVIVLTLLVLVIVVAWQINFADTCRDICSSQAT